ncbi:hypothetical protein [Streptomyces violens]|uniref:hypothetical protein n=1 Tax=Streptomyces violens TaxID=66377 RepID=UPI0004BFD8A1|nr:hypothetical protein [Streptomyces violens]
MPSTATETKPPTTTTTPEPVTRQQKEPVAQTKEPASAPGQTLAGVLIPGGALTGLIGFCWLSHQFGLPAVLLAVVACSAVATATLVVKTGRRIRRSGTGRLGRASSRSPGTGHRRPSNSGSAGRTSGGSGRVPAARTGSGSSLRKPAGAAAAGGGRMGDSSHKPGGSMAKKNRPSTVAPNTAGGNPARLGRNAAATGGTGRSLTPPKTPRTTAGSGGGTSPLKRSGAAGGGGRTGPVERLSRTLRRKSPTTPTSPAGAGSSRSQSSDVKGRHKHRAPSSSSPSVSSRAWKAAKALQRAVNRDRTGGKDPNPSKLKPQPKAKKPNKAQGSRDTGQGAGAKAAQRSFGAAMGAWRRGRYWAGRKLRQHTSALTRQRLRKAAAPVRATAHAIARHGSPLLAHAWRHGSRALLNAHLALGSVRYSSIGPNWLRPLARVFHTLTTPAARALAWAGTWGWLNRWMYRHTGGGSSPTPPRRKTPVGRRTSGVHRPVHSPTRIITAPATKGVPVGSIEPALPLQYAADAVRTAGAMMVLNPAGNMVGYEATINSLAEIQRAIGDVISMAAHSSRENFKVNEAIPEAYDDTAVYAHALAGRLDSIPTLYRIIHAEQIDNIENPTIQGAKWDQSANWQ